jgi:hypothetical protein
MQAHPNRIITVILIAIISVGLPACSRSDVPDDMIDPALGFQQPRVIPATEMLPDANIPALDPHTMADAHIEEVIGAGPRCTFHYTSTGDPVLGISQSPILGATAGVVMLNGDLIPLEAGVSQDGAIVALGADPIRFTIFPVEASEVNGKEQARLIFEIVDQLRVGYRGYYGCTGPEGDI